MNYPKKPSGPTCETCRCLRSNAEGEVQCAAGRVLDPVNCEDFKDAASEHFMLGGVSGMMYHK